MIFFVRFVNTMEKDVTLTVKKSRLDEVYVSKQCDRRRKRSTARRKRSFLIVIKPYEIATFGMKLNKQ